MGDMGAWQRAETGPVGGVGLGGGGSTEPGTDPEDRLEGEAPIDQVDSG